MKDLRPNVRNVILHQSYLIEPTTPKVVIPVFIIPEGWIFDLHSISIASTIYYERFLAGDDIVGDLDFRLSDVSEKIFPHVVIMPTGTSNDFVPPLIFQREVNILIDHSLKTFKREVTGIGVIPPGLDVLPYLPFPFRIEVRIIGVLRTR